MPSCTDISSVQEPTTPFFKPSHTMSLDGDHATPSARASMDTTVNINEDVASERSTELARKPPTESVYLNFRGSTGEDSIILAFNILKFGLGEEEAAPDAFLPLGPNSIFELTLASDVARVKLNKPLKTYLLVNGGANTIYNLTKPTSKDIPQIQLQSLKHKVSSKRMSQELVKDMIADYKSFEQTNRHLTEDVLSKLGGSTPDNSSDHIDDEDSQIPTVFENPDFHLDDPRIFRQVMENSQILPDPDSHDSTHIVHNTEVQEKLSQYLDRVEVELIQEISKTSDSFFSTLGEIQGIKAQSAECIDQFHNIQTKLGSIEEDQAKCGLKILDLLDERQNVCHLESSVLQLKEVVSWFQKAEKMFSEGRHSECLDSILIIEHLINGTTREDYPDPDTFKLYPSFDYPLVDLTRVPALTSIKNKLNQLKLACSKGYIESFVDLLLEDLRSHYNLVTPKDTMNRIYNSIDSSKTFGTSLNTSYTKVPTEVKEQLIIFIKNLYKSSHLVEAFGDYQNTIITEVKAIIRAHLPLALSKLDPMQLEALSNPESRDSSVPPDASQTAESTAMASNSLSSNIKGLTHEEYVLMMKTIFASLSECLRRLTIHQKLLLDLSLSSLSSNDTLDVMSLDITNAINRAIELTQVRLVKISNVRLEQLCDSSIEEYLKLFSYSSAYLLECEFINPGYNATGPGSSFNDWVKNHVGYYIHRFHLSSIKRFVANCDKEIWKEFTNSDSLAVAQKYLDEVLEYSKFHETDGQKGSNGKHWSNLLVFYEKDASPDEEKQQSVSQQTKLKIGDDEYMVPKLILDVVKNIRDYIIISSIFTSRAPTIKANVLTFFKVMNSRISQAILNAGATRTAGLKHITTKHLALCIQTIEFDHAFLSAVQYIFKNQEEENEPNQQGEDLTFAKIISNYKDHENELFTKLVLIMKDRTMNHCNSIVKIDWSEPLKPGQQCHQFMETLVKETSTVAKVLSKYMRETECSLILLQIFDNYKKLLLHCFCTELPQFKDFNEKHSLLKDIDYFRVKLGELPGYGNSGQVIWENVNALPTVEDARMEEIMRNNIEGERAEAARKSLEVNGKSDKNGVSSAPESTAKKEESTPQPQSDEPSKETAETSNISGEAEQSTTSTKPEEDQSDKSLKNEDVSIAAQEKLEDQPAAEEKSTEISEEKDKTVDKIEAEDETNPKDDSGKVNHELNQEINETRESVDSNQSESESKEETSAETKEESKGVTKEELKEESKEGPKEELKDEPKENKQAETETEAETKGDANEAKDELKQDVVANTTDAKKDD